MKNSEAVNKLLSDNNKKQQTHEQQTKKQGKELNEYIYDIEDSLKKNITQGATKLTPWFFNNMPSIYYHTTPRTEKIKHLSAIITGNIFETKQTIQIWDKEKTRVTFIGPLYQESNKFYQLLKNIDISRASLGYSYVSTDNKIFIATFFCRSLVKAELTNPFIQKKITESKLSYQKDNSNTDINNFSTYLENTDHYFLKYASTQKLIKTYAMLNHMLGYEGTHIYSEKSTTQDEIKLTIGIKTLSFEEIIEKTTYLTSRYNFNIKDYFISEFNKGYPEKVNILHIKLKHKNLTDPLEISQKKLLKALKTISWCDPDEYMQFIQKPFLFSLNAASLFRSIAVWIRITLSKENIYYYSEHNIHSTFKHNYNFSQQILTLFKLKFQPKENTSPIGEDYQVVKNDLLIQIDQIIDKVKRKILRSSVYFIDNCLKTNYFIHNKTGLAFKLDPNILDKKYYTEKPFAIIFIIGRNYKFFHIKWREIARGGLRVVLTKAVTEYENAVDSLLDEVYGLSNAQQMQNKDIPEGGSKGVIIVKPLSDRDKVVKASVNALLDLITPADETNENNDLPISNTNNNIIYLGPDENITDNLICWIRKQALKRKYYYANAFMSSKPDFGINHKKYGVTSQGLHIYVQSLLEHLNFNPKHNTFTVKMTGGTDGDVAGNELKLLYQTYPQTCKVIAISDGSGAAYDPCGLCWQELLNLIETNKPIAFFNLKRLSSEKTAFVIDISTRDNIKIRNELHNKTKTDIFIPAGGRPYTINDHNVNLFLDESGQPSSKIIVEGANIFFTDLARQKLQQLGVWIIKDSSANKTGVICSSYETIASIILEPQEFLKIKDIYIKQVINILTQKAKIEANLILQEFLKHNNRYSLIQLSIKISETINDLTDFIYKKIEKQSKQYFMEENIKLLIFNHCPQILVEKYSERILDKLPEKYLKAIIASTCASFIIYQEGLEWIYTFSEEHRHSAVMEYIHNHTLSKKMINIIEELNLNDKDKIKYILSKSCAKELTQKKLLKL